MATRYLNKFTIPAFLKEEIEHLLLKDGDVSCYQVFPLPEQLEKIYEKQKKENFESYDIGFEFFMKDLFERSTDNEKNDLNFIQEELNKEFRNPKMYDENMRLLKEVGFWSLSHFNQENFNCWFNVFSENDLITQEIGDTVVYYFLSNGKVEKWITELISKIKEVKKLPKCKLFFETVSELDCYAFYQKVTYSDNSPSIKECYDRYNGQHGELKNIEEIWGKYYSLARI